MTEKMVALKIRVEQGIESRLADHREAGQGVLEYVGMIIVAAFVIAAVGLVIKNAKLEGFVTTAINKVTSLGG